MSMESFEQFRQIVLYDPILQVRLRETTELRPFVELVIRVGEERGCIFTPEEVEAALRESRRSWIERWI
jgi:hypothetical protein